MSVDDVEDAVTDRGSIPLISTIKRIDYSILFLFLPLIFQVVNFCAMIISCSKGNYDRK